MVCLRSSKESVTKACALSPAWLHPHFLPTPLQPPPLLPGDSTANTGSSFLWPKGLTQRVRPNTSIWRRGISPSGPPPTPLASPRCTSCAVSTLNLSPFPGRRDLSQCRGLASSLPRRILTPSSAAPSPRVSVIESLCSSFNEFCVHRVAGTPGLLGRGLSIPHVVFFIVVLVV